MTIRDLNLLRPHARRSRAPALDDLLRRDVRTLSAVAETESPPLLVRLSFRMRLPIQTRWRAWAMGEIERRYGPDPSVADRDIVIPPFIDPMRPWMDGVTSTGGRIPRRPLAIRKADDQYAAGLRSDGTPAPRQDPLVEPIALLERLPERLWPWLPVLLLLTTALVVALGVAIALALT